MHFKAMRAGVGACLFGLVGLFLAQAHAAKWELVAQANAGFYYIDPRSIETDGDRRRAWTVLDYREDQKLQDGSRYRSTHAQVQFNCKARLARLVHLSYYSGPMMEGKVVLRQGMLQEWFEIEAGSPMQRMGAKVC